MIIFNKIRWKNFLSFGNTWTEINLSATNNTLIVGTNGSGKSTLLDALTFVLFGKSFRGVNKPQLINSVNKKNLLVEISFKINNMQYVVRRGLLPSIFEIYENDVLLNPSADVKDYQQHFEKQILKANYKSFCQVVILGSASFEPFMRLSLQQKRDIIEDLLDLKIFTLMNFTLKDKLQNNIKLLNDLMNEKILLSEKLKLLSNHVQLIKINKERIIEQHSNQINSLQEELKLSDKNILEHNNHIKKLSEELLEENKIINNIDILKEYKHRMDANISSLLKSITFFEKHDTCPSCTQSINKSLMKEIIIPKKDQINRLIEGIKEWEKKYEIKNKKLLDIDKTKKNIYELTIENQIRIVKKNNIETQISFLCQEISKLSKEIKNDPTGEISSVRENLDAAVTKIYIAEENKDLLITASHMLKDSGIKAKIIKQYIPIINKCINKFLSELELFAEFELNEHFHETIKSRFRDKFTYESFSQGERFRIDIALLFAWREIAKIRNSLSTNLLIMDEVFDSPLDFDGVEYLFKMLFNLKNTNIFIISPKSDLYDKFNSVIKFHRIKHFSRLNVEQ
jgi:DNA repair exonuclease SbcCD ATPase subunit